MKHFSDETCFDFVRRLLPPAQRATVEQHLDQGCERCDKMRKIWEAVAEVIRREVHYQPAEHNVHLAKALYASSRRTYLIPKLARSIPVVFDSFLDTSGAAVRAPHLPSPARHLLHRTGPWAIDLRLQREGGSRMSLAGQILRSGRKPAKAVVADVILLQGDTIVAETSTNPLGEFHLEYPLQKNLNMYLDIPGRQPLGITLPDPNEWSSPQ